jgi:hypothetical protein
MLRSNRLALFLAMLFVAPAVAWSQDRNVEFSITDSHPGLSGQLRAWGRLYVKLAYRSDQPVGFHIDGYAAGKKVPGASSNIAPSYPAGEGEALVWIAFGKAATIDEIRIAALDQRWQPLSAIRVPARLEWSPDASKNGPPPAWATRLDAEQQQLGKRQDQATGAKHRGLGERVVGIGALAILGYLVLQPMMISWLSGRWRIAAFVPLIAMVPLFLHAGYAFAVGSNLWPLGLIFFTPFATLYLLALAGVRWLVARMTRT